MKRYKFKIILVSLCLTFFTCNLFSQIGYQLGYVDYNSIPKLDVLSADGIQGGVTYDIKLKDLIYLHSAALLSVTYVKYDFRIGSDDFEINNISNFISIPLRFTFILPQTQNFDVFVFTGPTVRGKFYNFEGLKNIDNNEKHSFSNFYSPFNYGLELFYGAGIGFKYKSSYIKGNYDWGILGPTDNFKINSFSIAIGRIL